MVSSLAVRRWRPGRLAALAGAVVLAWAALGAAAAERAAADGPAEKLLYFGFEKEKVTAGWLTISKEDGDTCYVFWPGDRGRCLQALQKGDATEGQWAAAIQIRDRLSIHIPRDDKTWRRTSAYDLQDFSSLPWNWFRPGYLANLAEPEKFTQIAEKTEWTGYSSPGMRLEHAGLTHAARARFYTRYDEGGVRYTDEAMPRDWRGYSSLRMDVKSEPGQLSLRMAFEDLQVAPPVERRFIVPPGAWSTLEMDLDGAVRERKVDLGKIINFWVYLEEVSQPGGILIDNVRLSKQGVPARLPVIRGGPKVPRPVAPMPKIASGGPARDTARLALTAPAVLKIEGGNRPTGWLSLWAYDKSRLVLAQGDTGRFFTLDGGANWQLLKGRTCLPGGISSNPQAATDIDASGNMLFFGNFGHCIYHCAPSVDSMYFRRLLLAGDSWIPSPMYVVGGETRGCSQGRRIVALPDGRIWVAYRVHERQGLGSRIHAMYSDDGGMTWRGAGVNGELTGTLADTLVGGPSNEDSGVRKPLHDPLAIAPYGRHVAVFWGKWSSFDGRKWSEPRPVESRLLKPPVRYLSMATVGREIVLATDKGLVTWDGTSWKDDESVKGAFLTACGDRAVGFSVEDRGDGSVIRFWRRLPDGSWSSKEIASEPLPIAFDLREGDGSRCLAVPIRSCANFAPVAWTCKGQAWVKVLRGPVE